MSPVWSILPKPGFDQQVYDTLRKASKNMKFKVYKRDSIPKRFHYRNNERILPIFITPAKSWDLMQSTDKFKPKGLKRLTIGFHNTLVCYLDFVD